MNETDIEKLLNRIIGNQLTLYDLKILMRLTRSPKYERIIKNLMLSQLSSEYQIFTSN